MTEEPTSIRIGHNEDPPDDQKPPKLRRLERLVSAVFPQGKRVRPAKGNHHNESKVRVQVVLFHKCPVIVYHTNTNTFDVPFYNVGGNYHHTVEDAVRNWVENEIADREEEIEKLRENYEWLEGIDA